LHRCAFTRKFFILLLFYLLLFLLILYNGYIIYTKHYLFSYNISVKNRYLMI